MAVPAVATAGEAVRPTSFDDWMRAEQRRVFLLCYRMLGDRDEADAATQEVFLKAFQTFGGKGPVGVDEPARWLTRVAVNACLDRLRSPRWRFWRRRLDPEDEETVLTLQRSPNPSAEEELFAKQIARRLTSALGKLSERQRAVFVLRHYEDRSLEEIAALLSLDVGTVKAHLARALAKLRNELRDLYFRQAAGVGHPQPAKDPV
ncbi:MAG: RNA polymerase sigma factor [Bryobacterales bacterium]|nr:RNA polymerase sigma factor [Bryobacteraceae bacterium]MDW8354919.1 RNA polymerase sigma factor [Bryobacterales bacterium]